MQSRFRVLSQSIIRFNAVLSDLKHVMLNAVDTKNNYEDTDKLS